MELKFFKTETFFKFLIFTGILFAIFSIVLGWGGVQFMIHTIISKLMRLVPGSAMWETWKTIPVPVYIKFTLFNITNPDDLAKGAKPILTEIGPFTYLVDFDKFDFERNETIDTVKYSPTRTFIFQPDRSKGKEDDLITYINVIYVGVSHVAHMLTDVEIILKTLDSMLVEEGEKLTRTDKVKDLLFDGVSIQTYVDIANDPLVQQAVSVELPDDFKDGLFALFKGKNGTKDGVWECHTGIRDNSELGKLYSINGKLKLDIYKNDFCNAINGTDGTLNPPFIEPGITDLYVFLPQICRSIKWEFVKEADAKGIPIARYRFPDIQSIPENPDFACFCPKANPMDCDIHGVANLAACFGGAPLLYTKPHFLNVNSSIRKLVDGLHPNPDLHESRLDLHPLTGVTIMASIKMQFSIELVPWPAMPSFTNVSRSIIPLAWVELLAKLEGFNLFLIWSISFFLKLWPILRWLGLLGSLCLTFIGAVLLYRSRKHTLVSSIGTVNVANEEISIMDKDLGVWIKKFNQNELPVES